MDNKTSSGIGFAGVLTLIFIVLKLVGVINWSWIWVLCPIWINFLIFILLFCVWVWIFK